MMDDVSGPLSIHRGTGIGYSFPHRLVVDGEGTATRDGSAWLSDEMADRVEAQLAAAERVPELLQQNAELEAAYNAAVIDRNDALAEIERRTDELGDCGEQIIKVRARLADAEQETVKCSIENERLRQENALRSLNGKELDLAHAEIERLRKELSATKGYVILAEGAESRLRAQASRLRARLAAVPDSMADLAEEYRKGWEAGRADAAPDLTELRERANEGGTEDVPSVDVCGFCWDSECDGIGCIAALDPDDADDHPKIERLHLLLRAGRVVLSASTPTPEGEMS